MAVPMHLRPGGRFDQWLVLVGEREIDAAIRLHAQGKAPEYREIVRYNIALGKAIGVYGLKYDTTGNLCGG